MKIYTQYSPVSRARVDRQLEALTSPAMRVSISYSKGEGLKRKRTFVIGRFKRYGGFFDNI